LPNHGINIVKNIFQGAGNVSQVSLQVSNVVDVNMDGNTFLSDCAGNDVDVTGFHHGVRLHGDNLHAGD
jgi:hypothetical protein